MTRLLVSVRSLDEACLAAEAGVDVIDLKEPRHGSLGRAELDLAHAVADRFAATRPLSMALGELADWSVDDWGLLPKIPQGICFAKVGLARCATMPDWRANWQGAIESFASHCDPVAVVYADWQAAGAPAPARILDAAILNGCRAVLIDTYSKNRGNLFAHLDTEEIEMVFRRAKKHGFLTVIAGSLTLDVLSDALCLAPDYVAVRGAVCSGSRDGGICPHKLRLWCDLVHTNEFDHQPHESLTKQTSSGIARRE